MIEWRNSWRTRLETSDNRPSKRSNSSAATDLAEIAARDLPSLRQQMKPLDQDSMRTLTGVRHRLL